MSRNIPPVPALSPPWDAFLAEIDARLTQRVEIHCLGGFVLHVMFDLPRPTADIDFISAAPKDAANELIEIAPRVLSKLHLRALSPEDLVLAKLTRNSPKDIHDVRFLAEKGAIDADTLRQRYAEHLRPYLANTARHDLTLDLWMEEIAGVAPR